MARIDDDTLITPSLLRRFVAEAELEAGDGRHYAFMQRSNGELLAHNPYSPEIDPHQAMFAADVLKFLNRELHHDGAWVIAFTHPKKPDPGMAIFAQPSTEYRRYVLLWLDSDGDVQFAVEWIEGESELLDFPEVMAAGLIPIANQCEGAWAMWDLHMRKVIEPRDGIDTFQRARGQRAPSLRH